jgi:hypothetical protein
LQIRTNGTLQREGHEELSQAKRLLSLVRANGECMIRGMRVMNTVDFSCDACGQMFMASAYTTSW